MSLSEPGDFKLIDYFAVVGLDAPVMKKQSQELYVQDIELVKVPPEVQHQFEAISRENQIWIDLTGDKSSYMHVLYAQSSELPPISKLTICSIGLNKALKLRKKGTLDLQPIPIRTISRPDKVSRKERTHKETNETIVIYEGNYDFASFLNMPSHDESRCHCLCYSRSMAELPLVEVTVIEAIKTDGAPLFKIPKGLKNIGTKFLGARGLDRLICFKKWNILEKKFKGEILTRYPTKDLPYFPFNQPLQEFCFPGGLQISDSQSTPTFFTFMLTDENGTRIYGCTLKFHEQPNERILSFLQQRFPGANTKTLCVPKALCLISHFSFYEMYKEILKAVFQMHLSINTIPIQRVICNFMDEIPVPDKGNVEVTYDIGNQTLSFFRPLNQYEPYACKRDLEFLFRALRPDQIVTVFEMILLEKKVLLISKHYALISHATVALSSILYPFNFKSVFIPILPESMRYYLEAPFPFIIGCDPSMVTLQDLQDLQINGIYLDDAKIWSCEPLPKLPEKPGKTLLSRLQKVAGHFNKGDPMLQIVDEAFVTRFFDPDQIEFNHLEVRDAFFQFMQTIMKNYHKYIVDPTSKKTFKNTKDVFNKPAFLHYKDSSKPYTFMSKLCESSLFVQFIELRSFHGRSEYDEQIVHFDQIIKEKRTKKKLTVIKKDEPKAFVRAPPPNQADLPDGQSYTYATFPVIQEKYLIKPRAVPRYTKEKPVFARKLSAVGFIQSQRFKDLKSLSESQWVNFLVESIYFVWFILFSNFLPSLASKDFTLPMMDYAYELLIYAKKQIKHFSSLELIYQKLTQACGLCNLADSSTKLFAAMKEDGIQPDKITFGMFYQAQTRHLESLLFTPSQSYLSQDTRPTGVTSSQRSSNLTTLSSQQEVVHNPFQEEKARKLPTQDNDLVVTQDFCYELYNHCISCQNFMREDEIIAGFQKDASNYKSKCPYCRQGFLPYLKILLIEQEPITVMFLSPVVLSKEIVNFLDQNLLSPFTPEFRSLKPQLYWNLVFYFRMCKLPTFFLAERTDDAFIQGKVEELVAMAPSQLEKRASDLRQMKAKIDRQASRKMINSMRVGGEYEGSIIGSAAGSKGRPGSEGDGGRPPSVAAPSESGVSGASSVYIKGARSKKPIQIRLISPLLEDLRTENERTKQIHFFEDQMTQVVVHDNMKNKYEDIAKEHKRKAIDVETKLEMPVNEKDLANQIMNSGFQAPSIDTSLNVSHNSRRPPSNMRLSSRNVQSTFHKEEEKKPLNIPRIQVDAETVLKMQREESSFSRQPTIGDEETCAVPYDNGERIVRVGAGLPVMPRRMDPRPSIVFKK